MANIKHTDEEIITYLESAAKVADCDDKDCTYKDGCDGCLEYICKEALDLIKRQKSEVEKLEAEVERLTTILNSYALQYGTVVDKQKVIDKAKAEVAREIFEDIKKVSCRISESNQNGFIRVVCYQLSAEKFFELEKKYTEVKG